MLNVDGYQILRCNKTYGKRKYHRSISRKKLAQESICATRVKDTKKDMLPETGKP